jgi:hypothetical protein
MADPLAGVLADSRQCEHQSRAIVQQLKAGALETRYILDSSLYLMAVARKCLEPSAQALWDDAIVTINQRSR